MCCVMCVCVLCDVCVLCVVCVCDVCVLCDVCVCAVCCVCVCCDVCVLCEVAPTEMQCSSPGGPCAQFSLLPFSPRVQLALRGHS